MGFTVPLGLVRVAHNPHKKTTSPHKKSRAKKLQHKLRNPHWRASLLAKNAG